MRQWIVVGLLLGMAAPAWAMSSAAGAAGGTSSAGSAGSSASSDSSSDNDKLVLDARVDAASFVASDGAIRGARLEAALRSLRERDAAARQASDLQLAQAILAL
ncbi:MULTISPECIES: DUF2388 domain-containing protein [Pseudoxanthomonas]|uniref:DUF2388 domain-containing protein n=1 Tax=Pseudoxanthomonas winnipegensis TaxID=2480810 RepID=A0A4Q8L6M4_9GAMM|nr:MULTISPECIES: DUF2388 domain-containing protein [Pseudoxanthomonas]PZP61891.1 MAG: hypothetical protein DI597_07850 [Pseudoxanthomonas spadix]TAA21895.1 DUF2388 domain-containing protein [Pseudoxanthomonas winnipegensis]TMN19543.1 DUF2388 domain-containing protein [Pseudoxanthomonas sp. X-1]UAY73075.1 DUF2388 domain-containing protein [Pseudoxanthomonas sp. X-1]